MKVVRGVGRAMKGVDEGVGIDIGADMDEGEE